MEDGERRSVQDTGRERLRPGRFSSVSAADQHGKGGAIRRSPNRPLHHALPASVQVEAAADKRTGQKDRGHKAGAAGAARTPTSKRKTRVAAALSSIQSRVVSDPIVAARRNDKRLAARGKTRMGRVRPRVRGGATHPCPLCNNATRVLRTTKVSTTVQRHRQCKHCHFEYLTTERRMPVSRETMHRILDT